MSQYSHGSGTDAQDWNHEIVSSSVIVVRTRGLGGGISAIGLRGTGAGIRFSGC